MCYARPQFEAEIEDEPANKEVTKREIKFNSWWRQEQTSRVCQISSDKKSGVKEAMTGVDDSVEG